MNPSFENFNENNECVLCFDDITDNYVYYKDNPDSEWTPCKYCSICIQDLIDNQWSIYTEQIKNETCMATLRRLIEEGPPINFRDKKAVPCNNPTKPERVFQGETQRFTGERNLKATKA